MGSFKISLFARTPLATAAEFAKSEWLDLAFLNNVNDQGSDRLGWLDLEKNSRVCTPDGDANQVAQVIARPAATSFPLFGKLVVELQNKIWVMVSLRHSRIIKIVEEDVDVSIHPNDDEYTVTGAKRPKFVNACKGALSAMVGVYRPMFHLDPSQYHGHKKGVFVNPDIDVIDFVSLRFLRGKSPPLNYIGALKYRADFSMIRHVCFPVQEFHDNFKNVAKIVQQLPKLESVVVEADLIDRSLTDTLYLQFEFEDINYTRPYRLPRSDMVLKVVENGIPFFGTAAIGILFAIINNLTHRAGILESTLR